MNAETKALRHQLTELVREHDLEQLAELLCEHEHEPRKRQLVLLAIDKASRRRMPVIDMTFELAGTTQLPSLEWCDRTIAELREWLAAHPHPSTPQGLQARADRERELERVLACRELIAEQGDK